MFLLLVVLFLVVPIVELYVIVQVAGGIGVFETIGLLIVVSLVGAWLVRREGTSVLRKMQSQLNSGQMPTKQLVDGGLILFAGALMLTPGFVTDAVGVLLLLPPTRIVCREVLIRRFRGRVQSVAGGGPGPRFASGPIFDVHATEPEEVELTRDDPPDNIPPALP